MNKFQKAGLAVVVATGMAFAQLWSVSAPYGQVQFPWVQDCINGPSFNESDENDPCYKTLGGWWFGFVSGPPEDVGDKTCAGKAWMPPSGGNKSKINKVEANIGGSWVTFVGPDDPVGCEGPAITDKSNGASLMSADGLELKLTIGPGDVSIYEPSIASLAVNLSASTSVSKDVSAKGGFCLAYTSNHDNTMEPGVNTGSNLAIELGWNEGEKGSEVLGFDTWYSLLPTGSGVITKDFAWTDSSPTATTPGQIIDAGDFIQENWTLWPDNSALPGPWPITKATKEMTAVKIRLKGYVATIVNFKLIKFGFKGECGSTPIVAKGTPSINPVSFEMVGKTLSMNSSAGKPLTVQIINLQGAIVQSKTMSNGDNLNLQSLPTGIYMVRVPAMGYVAKYAIK